MPSNWRIKLTFFIWLFNVRLPLLLPLPLPVFSFNQNWILVGFCLMVTYCFISDGICCCFLYSNEMEFFDVQVWGNFLDIHLIWDTSVKWKALNIFSISDLSSRWPLHSLIHKFQLSTKCYEILLNHSRETQGFRCPQRGPISIWWVKFGWRGFGISNSFCVIIN